MAQEFLQNCLALPPKATARFDVFLSHASEDKDAGGLVRGNYGIIIIVRDVTLLSARASHSTAPITDS